MAERRWLYPMADNEDGLCWYRRDQVSRRGARKAYASLSSEPGRPWHFKVTPAFMREDVNYEGGDGPYFWLCSSDHLEAIAVWEVETIEFIPGALRRRTRQWFPRWNWGRRGTALWGFGRDRKARWFDRLLLGRDVDHIYPQFSAGTYLTPKGYKARG